MKADFEANPANIFFRCVEDSSEAIMVSDDKGTLVYVNPAWCQIYGYTKEEALGQTPRLLHSGMQSDEFYRDMWDRIRNPAIAHWKGELINKAKDGTLVPVLLTITPFKADSGAIRGFMGIALDISEKKELESRVAHQDRLASIGMLASGLAHEVGTPLGVVRGRAEFLLMKSEGNEEFRKNLEVITTQIDRISKLIRSLLRVSRGLAEVQLSDVDLNAVINEVLALVGQNFREDRVDVRVKVPQGLKVRGDFARLEQILLNLLMNSIHAIRKAVKEGTPRAHFMRIETIDEGEDTLRLEIEDTGCGISQDNMKKLFKPFFTTKDIGEGTGLGLAIVAQLVQEIEGVVSVKSAVDQGTTFSIVLRK